MNMLSIVCVLIIKPSLFSITYSSFSKQSKESLFAYLKSPHHYCLHFFSTTFKYYKITIKYYTIS